jgi:hypothetical protein
MVMLVLLCGGWMQDVSNYGARLHVAGPTVNIAIAIADDVLPPGGMAAVRRGLEAWSHPQCTSLRFEVTPSAEHEVRWVKEGWAHGVDDAAHTVRQLDERKGLIQRGVIELNGNKRLSALRPTPTDAVDLEGLVMHEAGHLLGLAHAPLSETSVMRPRLKTGMLSERTLDDDDKKAVCALHPRMSDTSTNPLENGRMFTGMGMVIVFAGAVVAWAWWRWKRAR